MPGSIIPALSPARIGRAALLAAALICCVPVAASAGPTGKVITYHGYRIKVPRGWPVYDLAKDPATCVRFNRHAVYLGDPGVDQRCPAHTAGRTEAILLQPIGAGAASVGAGTQVGGPAAAGVSGGSSGLLFDRARGLLITATWKADPAQVRRALGLGSLRALSSAASVRPAAKGLRNRNARAAARIASASTAVAGGIYTGLGFDVCSTPSHSQMSAWSSTSYHAVGVYIGGTNMACAQPNLSATWVSEESVAGWHLIPIYVGLQAPSNSCGCAAISKGSAASEGRAAAVDAVNQAETLGMGPGNPIYDDMEAYPRGSSNSPAVLAFLGAWTAQLHADGYKSGVYSSDDSGITDLVSKFGTGYSEPDELWIANWNGSKSTNDANVPAGEWADHQRLHQYDGGHNETHHGVTLNIDGDYLDASTAAAGTAGSAAVDPAPSSPPTIAGQTVQGDLLTESHGSWSNAPTSYSYQWEDCNTAGNSCMAIPGATAQTYTLGTSDIGHTIRVIEMATNTDGTGGPAVSKQTSEVLSLIPLYWLYTAYGNVAPSLGTAWYGSPAARGFSGSSVTGMAATTDGNGYWLVGRAAHVFAYGDAARFPALAHAHPIRGIVAAPAGRYWLYTAYGNVYASSGAAWYGSPAGRGFRGSSVTGMTATTDGNGYWLVDSAGRVFAFGDAATLPAVRHAHAIRGIVAAPGGGYWLYTAHGNVYSSRGATWYGSPAARGFRGSSVVGMAATADGNGYWLVDSAGRVFAFGDAANYRPPKHAHPVVGIAGG